MASMKAGPSRAWTLALSVSAVSPGATLTTFWTTMGPPSTSSVTSCMVQPLSVSFASMTAWCTARSIPPACLGSSEGCTLTHRPAQKSVNSLDRIRMYPTNSTYSTPAPTKTEVHSASNCSLVNPFEDTNSVVTVGPRLLPLSRMGAALRLLTTATISACRLPSLQASITGTRAVPRVDPSTPMRSFLRIAPLAMSVRKCLRSDPSASRKAICFTALYDDARASVRLLPIPVTASTRPPEHLVTSSSSTLVPAWYTLTPFVEPASSNPAISMPLGYFSG
mmetsp:Transcript_6849/g.14873  ORF Transcript_6849/g.14873 Transcript_6849/m.14873 type:complete len:279 (+) Transcript_6849:1169-2005(+)